MPLLAQSPLVTLKRSRYQCTADDSLGPFSNCRFDFTLLFEQYFLSGIPSAILLLACTIRIHQLHRQDQKVAKNHMGLSKLVRS
jgi:ATP-binding cassette, subfamily C (CFTR/MRP), member 1